MKILKFFIALWLGSAMITFVFMPSVGIYILFFPTMPFIELSTYFSTQNKNQKILNTRLENSIHISEGHRILAKKICNLEHLDKDKTNRFYFNKAKKFCTLEDEDKIYFFKDCSPCSTSSSIETGYVLVRDEEAIASVLIEKHWIDNPAYKPPPLVGGPPSGFNVPIIEQLH